MDIKLYIWHKVIWYHWRRSRSNKTTLLAICYCGWKDQTFRRSFKTYLKQLICKHDWADHEASFGRIGGDDSEYQIITMRQCSKCIKTETMDYPGPLE